LTYAVNVSETAKRDLREAAEYIANDNKTAADRLLVKVAEAAKSLSENPARQPLVRDEILASRGLRLLPVGKYNLFYIIREGSVSIIRFIHSRRDWANIINLEDMRDVE